MARIERAFFSPLLPSSPPPPSARYHPQPPTTTASYLSINFLRRGHLLEAITALKKKRKRKTANSLFSSSFFLSMHFYRFHFLFVLYVGIVYRERRVLFKKKTKRYQIVKEPPKCCCINNSRIVSHENKRIVKLNIKITIQISSLFFVLFCKMQQEQKMSSN